MAIANTAALHNSILAVCPIDGVDSDGRINFRPEATDAQKAAAQAVVAGWQDPAPVRQVTGTQFWAALRDLGWWDSFLVAASTSNKKLDSWYLGHISPNEGVREDNAKLLRLVTAAAAIGLAATPVQVITLKAIFDLAVTE